ncbi:MAG: hypothetical protein OIF32_04105 [Campylobacterales bacterium]|nr:hypothetical protein [Campylobacterales bacterium]
MEETIKSLLIELILFSFLGLIFILFVRNRYNNMTEDYFDKESLDNDQTKK